MDEPWRDRWEGEIAALRAILAGEGLAETEKWSKPCFTSGGANVALIQPFRDELRVMFFKGAILPDPDGLLGPQGENTQGARVMRLRSLAEVAQKAAGLRALVRAAIAAEEAGLKPAYPAKDALVLPDVLRDALAADAGLAAAWAGLTPGRRRSWVLHIAGARQASTQAARLAKAAAAIRAGRGCNEG